MGFSFPVEMPRRAWLHCLNSVPSAALILQVSLASHRCVVMPGPTQRCSHFTGRKCSANASSNKGDGKRKNIQFAKASYTFSEFFHVNHHNLRLTTVSLKQIGQIMLPHFPKEETESYGMTDCLAVQPCHLIVLGTTSISPIYIPKNISIILQIYYLSIYTLLCFVMLIKY